MGAQLLGVLREIVAAARLDTARGAEHALHATGARLARRPRLAHAADAAGRPGRSRRRRHRLPAGPRRGDPQARRPARRGGRDRPLARPGADPARSPGRGAHRARRCRARRPLGVADDVVPRPRRARRRPMPSRRERPSTRVYRTLPGELAPKLALALSHEVGGDAGRGRGVVRGRRPHRPDVHVGVVRAGPLPHGDGRPAGAIAAYGGVLDTSSAHADALMAQAELLLDGARPGDVSDVTRAASLIEQVPADRERRGPLAARVLECALAAASAGATAAAGSDRARRARWTSASSGSDWSGRIARWPARPAATPSASRSSIAPTPCDRGRGGDRACSCPARACGASALRRRRVLRVVWSGARARPRRRPRARRGRRRTGGWRVGPRAAPRTQRGRRLRRRRRTPGGGRRVRRRVAVGRATRRLAGRCPGCRRVAPPGRPRRIRGPRRRRGDGRRTESRRRRRRRRAVDDRTGPQRAVVHGGGRRHGTARR